MSLTYSGTQTGILQCMGGSVNLNSIISAVAPGGGGGSVNSVGGASGTIGLSSPDGSILIGNPDGSSLTFEVDTSVIATKASVDTAQEDANNAQGDATLALTRLPLVRQDTAVFNTPTPLTTSWAPYHTISFTTTLPSCSIIVWCDADFTQTTGNNANVSIRLTITPTGQATQTSPIRSIDIQNNHRQNLCITWAGTGHSEPDVVSVSLQAIDNTGNASINVSALLVMVNPLPLA
jgi:hypothetical protein